MGIFGGMQTMDVLEDIKNKILKGFIETGLEGAKETEVTILDPRNDGVHLEAIVVSPVFKGKSLIQQHKMVTNPLKKDFSGPLHALGLKTYTPEQWEAQK